MWSQGSNSHSGSNYEHSKQIIPIADWQSARTKLLKAVIIAEKWCKWLVLAPLFAATCLAIVLAAISFIDLFIMSFAIFWLFLSGPLSALVRGQSAKAYVYWNSLSLVKVNLAENKWSPLWKPLASCGVDFASVDTYCIVSDAWDIRTFLKTRMPPFLLLAAGALNFLAIFDDTDTLRLISICGALFCIACAIADIASPRICLAISPAVVRFFRRDPSTALVIVRHELSHFIHRDSVQATIWGTYRVVAAGVTILLFFYVFVNASWYIIGCWSPFIAATIVTQFNVGRNISKLREIRSDLDAATDEESRCILAQFLSDRSLHDDGIEERKELLLKAEAPLLRTLRYKQFCVINVVTLFLALFGSTILRSSWIGS